MAQDPSGSGKNPPPQGSRKEAATQTGTGDPGGGQEQAAAPGIDPEQLQAILRALAGAGGVPITLSPAKLDRVRVEDGLDELTAVTVAFPPCADVLLALIDGQVSDRSRGSLTSISAFADTRSWRNRKIYNSTKCSTRTC